MCKAKPGPRCSGHAKERIGKAEENVKSVRAELTDWREQENERRTKKDPNAAYPKETEAPKRLQQKMANAYSRERAAQRGFYATPAGLQFLQQAEPLAHQQRIDRETTCEDYLRRTYGDTDEKALKEKLDADKDWRELKQNRTSARSYSTRMSNARRVAARYRESDKQAAKFENSHQGALKALKGVNSMESLRDAEQQMKGYWDQRRSGDAKAWYANSAEMQRASDYSSSTPVASSHGHVGRQELSTHKVDLPQGGRARVEVTSGITQSPNGGYTVEHYTTTTIIPENEEKDADSRKGFGKGFAPFQHKYEDGQKFETQKEAQDWLRANRMDNHYKQASRSIYSSTLEVEGAQMKRNLIAARKRAAASARTAPARTPEMANA